MLHDKALKWLCKKQAKDKQGGACNNAPPIMVYQLVILDLPAGPDGVFYASLAHNLMMSSTKQLTDRQQTDRWTD